MNHPADKGGPTCFGITEAVARAHGYAGAMRTLPRIEAAAIYRRLYWLRPRFDQVATRSARIAAELFDTGVNMGPAVATTFLQRALTALNRNAKDYADLTPACRGKRGKRDGTAACARGAPGRALPPPCRAPTRQRGVSLRLASEPRRHNRLTAQPRTSA